MYDNIYKKISKNSKHISLYNSVSFIFKCFHDKRHTNRCKKYHKSTEPESCQKAKIFSLFLSFFFVYFFFFFIQASSKLYDSFTMVFAQNRNILH